MKQIITKLFGYLFSSYLIIFVWLGHLKIFTFNSPWITFSEGVIGLILLFIGIRIIELSIEELIDVGMSIIKDIELMSGFLILLGILFVVTAILYAILGGIFGVLVTPENTFIGILLFLLYLALAIISFVLGAMAMAEACEEREEEDNYFYA